MKTIIFLLILSLAFAYYLFKKSKSNFFGKSEKDLKIEFKLLQQVLSDYNFTRSEIKDFEDAFVYFFLNPLEFDGATIVRDFYTINNLDAPAMVHDYSYIHAKNTKDRIKADKQYLKNMLQLGVHPISAYLRAYTLQTINYSGIYNIFKLFTK
jgi:hypothetical protein